ncbi:MAG: hypothetical protein ACRCY6_00015 [Bacteroidales bacterium]
MSKKQTHHNKHTQTNNHHQSIQHKPHTNSAPLAQHSPIKHTSYSPSTINFRQITQHTPHIYLNAKPPTPIQYPKTQIPPIPS